MNTFVIGHGRPDWLTALAESRALLYLHVLCAALLVWIPHYPPLIDLPQHAAQVSLLLDLLRGDSPWAANVQLNFFTPYLVGYGSIALVAQFLPIAVAVKVVLSLAVLAFFWAATSLRKQLEAPPFLDWLVLASYFGFAFKWGFLTFLVAAPIGLLFIQRAIAFSQQPSLGKGFILTLLGVLTFFSHGLIFIACLAIGGLYALLGTRSLGDLVKRLSPYAALVLLAVIYYWFAKHAANNAIRQDNSIFWALGLKRPLSFFSFQWTITSEEKLRWYQGVQFGIHVLLLAAPFLLGMRLRLAPRRFAPLLVLTAIALVAPSAAMTTNFLFERFALFLLPFYVLLFEAPRGPLHAAGRFSRAALVAVPLLCLAKTAIVGTQFQQFDKESGDYARAIAQVPAGQRVMSLMDDRGSAPMSGGDVYLHFVAWYQAERQGFVEMNFAQFLPQIVRFKPGVEFLKASYEWAPRRFDWEAQRMGTFDYFVVRGANPDAWLPAKAPCRLHKVAQEGLWTVYQPGAACRRAETAVAAAGTAGK